MKSGGRYNRIIENGDYISLLDSINEYEKDRRFCRHGIAHLLDTARIMYIITLEETLEYSKDIIYAAALLHDIGRYEQYTNGTPHNIAGERTAKHILIQCGYGTDEMELISKAISEHRTPADDTDRSLGALLYRADKLSRMCFCCSAENECYWAAELKNENIII